MSCVCCRYANRSWAIQNGPPWTSPSLTSERPRRKASSTTHIGEEPAPTVALSLSPNPDSDGVRVGASAGEAVVVTVLDVLGRAVAMRTLGGTHEAWIDLRGMAAGVYVVRAETAAGTVARHLVRR